MEAVKDDIHAIAEAFELFLTLHGAGHIEMEIERHQLERVVLQFAIIANGHDEIQAIDGHAFPAALFDFLTQPFARNLSPDFLANEGCLFVANPTRFTRENENRITGERDQHVDVTMDNLEVGNVAYRAFETGVLISADNQSVDLFGFHGRANVFVASLDFVLAGHLATDLWLMRPANFGGGERIHLGGVHKRFDSDLFPFGIARAARRAVIQCFNAEAGHYRSVRIPENGCMFGWDTEHAVMAGLDSLDELVVLGNFGAGNGNENLGFDTVLRMFFSQIENELFDGGTHFLQRNRGRNAHI